MRFVTWFGNARDTIDTVVSMENVIGVIDVVHGKSHELFWGGIIYSFINNERVKTVLKDGPILDVFNGLS